METTDFDKNIAELLHIGDDLRLIEQEKNELEKENKRLKTMYRKLTEQMIEHEIDWNEKYTILNTKYNSCMEELNQCKRESTGINQLEKQGQPDEQVLLENAELKKLLADRDNEIIWIYKQLENLSKDIKQRISKRKKDFEILYNTS